MSEQYPVDRDPLGARGEHVISRNEPPSARQGRSYGETTHSSGSVDLPDDAKASQSPRVAYFQGQDVDTQLPPEGTSSNEGN